MMEPERYEALLAREERYWGSEHRDPRTPQLWDDPALFEISLGGPRRRTIERAAAGHRRVLDLGCGDGDFSLEIAALGPHVTGIDLSAQRIERAWALAAEQGATDRVTFTVGDLNTLELPERGFDCVVAHNAIHHILELDHLLDQIARTLEPGGVFLVNDFTGTGLLEKIAVAGVYAVLPTLQSYSEKWAARRRFTPFLASARQKREALARGESSALHGESPFEGISQEQIEPKIEARFEIVERFTFCPSWYNLVPKLRVPRSLRIGLLRACAPLDRALNRSGLTRGSYCFIEARRR
jgi:ubiquinone/menaquinone biosynthesis C-methylase UbiE